MKSCPFMAPHSTVKIAWEKAVFMGQHGCPSQVCGTTLVCAVVGQSTSCREEQVHSRGLGGLSDLFPPLSDWNLVCGLTHLWDHKTNITCSLRLSMQPLQPLVDYFQFQYICMGHLVGGSLFSRQWGPIWTKCCHSQTDCEAFAYITT